VTSSVNPSVFGQSVTFTATVSPVASTGTPTGTVTFFDGGSPIGTGTLSGGVTTFITSALAVGSHTITANYSGDDIFSPSTGSLTGNPQVVNKTSTTTGVISSQNPSTFGQSVTFTATVTAVTPGAGTPTGTVTFFDGGSPIGTGTLNGGVATFTTSVLAVGNHTITTSYGGDGNFNGSRGSLTGNPQVVNAIETTTTLISSQNPSTVGQPVTFTATVSGGSSPTGTVTFKDGAATLATVALNGSGQSAFTTSSLSVGTHPITATYNGDANNGPSSSTPLSQVVNQGATTITLTSSQNPIPFGQTVMFTATVTGRGPTGTVTFKDGGTTIGSGTLNGSGQATFATCTLSVGSHSISATYNGDANNAPGTSSPLLQAINVSADSVRLRALQLAVTKLAAQGSGQMVSSAIDAAIADGFAGGGAPITPSETGLRFNFAAEPQEKSKVEERVGDAFSSLAYARRDPVYKAPVLAPPQPKDWLAWAEVRGVGWNTGIQTGDIKGAQTNALLGLTRRLTPDLIVGIFGGYEHLDYTSQLLLGRLKGDGWTGGGYLGWRFLPGVRFDAGVGRSGVSYDGVTGAAFAGFPGQRWLATAGLTGLYKTIYGLEIEPSARLYALWEHDNAYTDSLGTVQSERNFSSGRASVGGKLAYPRPWSSALTVAPYAGLYADYYFNRDDSVPPAAPLLLPIEFVHGFSARVTSGVAVAFAGGAQLALGSEVGGLGSDFKVWTVRGRAAVPF
jgi:hypothetical protein